MSEIMGTLFKYLLSLLGVGAVVLILYQTFGSNKIQNAIADVTQLSSNAQSLYNGQATFTTLTNTTAIAGKLAPSGMIPGGAGLLSNPWGGAVTIAVNATSSSQFDITEPGVPIDACSKMIAGLSNLVGLKVNGTAITTFPVDAGTGITACTTGATAAGLTTLIFSFAH